MILLKCNKQSLCIWSDKGYVSNNCSTDWRRRRGRRGGAERAPQEAQEVVPSPSSPPQGINMKKYLNIKKLSSPPQGALQRSVQGWVRPLLHQTGGKRRWHELFMINITITMKTTMINDHELGGSYDLMTILWWGRGQKLLNGWQNGLYLFGKKIINIVISKWWTGDNWGGAGGDRTWPRGHRRSQVGKTRLIVLLVPIQHAKVSRVSYSFKLLNFINIYRHRKA